MPEDIDSERMDGIRNSTETWVIDFWAEWCGPCKKYSPVFEKVSEEVDSVKFGKVNMEENQDVGQQAGVRALPTTLVIREGEEVARNAGAMDEDELKRWIEENV